MILGRVQMIGGMMATLLGAICPVGEKSATAEPSASLLPLPPPKAEAHAVPPGVDYSKNPTVFGKILRGELPAFTYGESDTLVSFRDIAPSAPLHALVIPKRLIPSVKSLLPSDADLVLEMKDMAMGIVEKEQPKAFRDGDYILCFHIPPFSSVRHMHLHVLAPASEMSYFKRYGKYQVGTSWCTGVDEVVSRLNQGGRAVRSLPL